jgi:rhodanese-related sulfurtransferase
VKAGILVIVLCGVVLGLGFNQLGRKAHQPHGLAWIGQPKAELASLEAVKSAPPAGAAAGAAADDPMGGFASNPESGLPEIPDLDRPLSVELDTVRKFVEANAAMVLDAREPDDYKAGHIPGALNVPYDTAGSDPARLGALDSGGRPIIIYCGGGTCEVSMSLAETLIYQHAKRKVLVYMGGWPDWQGAGLPVVQGTEPGGSGR